MPDWIFWVAGFLALGALGAYGAAQRAKQAQGLAQRLGFRFVGAGGYDVVGPFVLLGHPHTIAPGIANIARGEREGVELALFDYATESNEFTSVVLRAPGLDLPHVAVGPPSMVSLNGRIVVRPRLSTPLEFVERPGFKSLYWATAEHVTDLSLIHI